ncbi:MAG TPA: hypothetical protein VNX18_04105 [Bryobacteraceae bacterium]|nr:hypothetical protein [Bryobacteraceae bacterium]
MRGFVSLAILAGALMSAQEPQTGPTQLIVTYRCPPPRRAAFRQYMTELGVQRFDRWKQEGVLKDYRFLFNWFVDVDTWDAMAVLSFPNYAAVARWKDIEKANPGGLARDALDMAWPLNSYSADMVARETGESPLDPTHTVYFVIPYDFASGAAYRDYATSVLIPQAKASIREGVVTGFSAYVNRYPGGKRWQGLVVLEYRDMDAFARRDEVIAKIRALLRNDPAYKTAESKQMANPEREAVIADSVGPR